MKYYVLVSLLLVAFIGFMWFFWDAYQAIACLVCGWITGRFIGEFADTCLYGEED